MYDGRCETPLLRRLLYPGSSLNASSVCSETDSGFRGSPITEADEEANISGMEKGVAVHGVAPESVGAGLERSGRDSLFCFCPAGESCPGDCQIGVQYYGDGLLSEELLEGILKFGI